jgi:hypothetical protein
MQITEIRIALRNDDKLKAFVSVTFDDQFVVRGMKIIEGKDGHLFVAMPSRKKARRHVPGRGASDQRRFPAVPGGPDHPRVRKGENQPTGLARGRLDRLRDRKKSGTSRSMVEPNPRPAVL